MVWRLGVKLPKPIYKKFSCFKNESFVWCIFLNLAAHAVPLFISSKILPLQMLYAEKVSSIIFDVSCMNAPSNICDLFTKANSKHKHAWDQGFFVWKYVQNFKTESKSRFFFQVCRAKLWNEIPNEFRQLSKGAFKKHFSWLFALENGSRGRLCWSAHSPTKNDKFCSLD